MPYDHRAAPWRRRWSHRLLRITVGAAACLGLAVTLNGCGDGTSASAASVSVEAISVPGLGRVLADSGGYALYAYMPDDRGMPKCSGVCAKQWPPLVLPAGTSRAHAGTGTHAGLLGTTKRSNGTLQVTYNGWPLYRYVHDGAPGEVTGQADDMGSWYMLTPNGSVDRRLVTKTNH